MTDESYRSQEDVGEEPLPTTVPLSALVKLHRVPRNLPSEQQARCLRGQQEKAPAPDTRKRIRPAWL